MGSTRAVAGLRDAIGRLADRTDAGISSIDPRISSTDSDPKENPMTVGGDSEEMRRRAEDVLRRLNATARGPFSFGFGPSCIRDGWTPDQVHGAIIEIGAGNDCPGCHASWTPDITPGQRTMRHTDACPYAAASERLGI